MEEIRMVEVKSSKELKKFISFPDKLYKNNMYRVTPLHTYEKTILSKTKNPAFDHCEASYWLAYRNNEIVGRIGAFVNHKFIETWNDNSGRFGWIDFIDDIEVSNLLFKTAGDWLRSKGMISMQGPLGFTDMDMEGMLVDGFNEQGTQAVIYNYPYYPDNLEKLGFEKDVDWVQKEIRVPDKVPDKLKRFSKLIAEKYELRPLKVKKAKELLPYARSMFHTLNEAFSSLYGFVPLTEKQIDYYISQYFSIIKPELVCFVVDKHSEVIGFGISMPSLSKALIKARGKLFPFGFLRILKAINGKNEVVDMYLNGVRPDYHGKGIHSIYYTELMQAYIDRGIKYAISNPQMENNTSALQLWKHYEHRTHLRRRCYSKTL
jgi:ribosomal protein S18 acetylase RimI-like enzyme